MNRDFPWRLGATQNARTKSHDPVGPNQAQIGPHHRLLLDVARVPSPANAIPCFAAFMPLPRLHLRISSCPVPSASKHRRMHQTSALLLRRDGHRHRRLHRWWQWQGGIVGWLEGGDGDLRDRPTGAIREVRDIFDRIRSKSDLRSSVHGSSRKQ
jgi:hypothetical protein